MLALTFGLIAGALPTAAQAQAINSDELMPPAGSVVAVAGVSGVDLWDAPGKNVIVQLEPGMLMHASARSVDNRWLLMETDDARRGWVAATDVVAFGLDRLPVALETEVTAGIAVVQPVDTVRVDDGSLELALDATNDSSEDATMPDGAESTNNTKVRAGTASTTLATVNLTDTRLNVRADADAASRIISKIYPSEIFTVRGRNAAGDWLLLNLPEIEGEIGWVAAEYMVLQAELDTVPIVAEVSNAPAHVEPSTEAQTTPVAATLAVAAQTSGSDGLTGTLVFQTSNGGQIYAYELTTGALTSLTTGFDPAVSPDGSTVAFTRDGGENGLYTIGIDGKNERLIYSGRSGLRSPKWSPDSQSILFTRGDEYVECYQMGRMGCPTEDEFKRQFPFLSTDDYPLVKDYQYKLAVVDHNGDNYHDLATLNSAQMADWNEAGIVYQSAAGLQITDDAPDAENQLLAFDYLKPFYRDPDWQPNGGKIVFQSKEGSHWEIWTVNPDGTGMTALTRPVTTLVDELPSNVAPTWSPDGTQIAFLSNRGDDHEAGPWQLWIMNADGSDQRPLALNLTFEYSHGGEQMVSWAR